MKGYTLYWKIEIDADSPREAARRARDIQLDPNNTATVFEVFEHDGDGEPINVDLLDVQEEP